MTQAADGGQAGNELIGHGFGEVLLFRTSGQALERQNRERLDLAIRSVRRGTLRSAGHHPGGGRRERRQEQPRSPPPGAARPRGCWHRRLETRPDDRFRCLLQRTKEIARRLPSLAWILRQAAAQKVVHGAGHQRFDGRERRRIVPDYGGTDAGCAVAIERPRAGDHLEHDRTEREQIAPGVRVTALDLFRSHVPDRPHDRAAARRMRVVALQRPGLLVSGSFRKLSRQRRLEVLGRSNGRRPEFRKAEIEQLGAARGQHHVGRFEIAMDDRLGMRVVERAGDLDRVRQRLLEWQPAVLSRAASVSPSRYSMTRKSTSS